MANTGRRMNTYSTTDGVRYTRPQIETRIRKAKQATVDKQRQEHGFNFCEICHRSAGDYLDCSHKISVKQCLENGMAELAWHENNIRVLCRTCHREHDGLSLKFND